MSKKQKRFEVLGQRAVNRDGFIKEWLDVGLVAMESPNDPKPGIKIQDGKVVELDGKPRKDFDMIDTWIADHCIDTTVAEEAMAPDSLKVARMLADINVPRDEIVRLSVGMTPAKYVDVLRQMNVVELMMAMQKLRPRRTPSNQAHVTNLKDCAPPFGGGCRRSLLPRLCRNRNHGRRRTLRTHECPFASGRGAGGAARNAGPMCGGRSP